MSRKGDYTKMNKVLDYRFPHNVKKLGIAAALMIFLFLVVYKFDGANEALIKDFLKTLLLAVLLIASFSKDKIEDEYTKHVRYQSYSLAFIFAVSYAIGMPLLSFVLDLVISNFRRDGNINFHDISAFEVLFMLICFQMSFYAVLKRMGCEE